MIACGPGGAPRRRRRGPARHAAGEAQVIAKHYPESSFAALAAALAALGLPEETP